MPQYGAEGGRRHAAVSVCTVMWCAAPAFAYEADGALCIEALSKRLVAADPALALHPRAAYFVAPALPVEDHAAIALHARPVLSTGARLSTGIGRVLVSQYDRLRAAAARVGQTAVTVVVQTDEFGKVLRLEGVAHLGVEYDTQAHLA